MQVWINPITTNSFQFAHFCGYSAIVAIYVFIIKQPSKTNMIKKYLKAAERCQEQIKQPGEVESFARRCASVLKELHAEVTAKLGGRHVAIGRLTALRTRCSSSRSKWEGTTSQETISELWTRSICGDFGAWLDIRYG